MNPVIMQAITYGVVFLLMMLGANWYMGGLFINYIKVRGSRGKKVMAKVRTHIDDYYVPATISGETLRYQIRGSKDHKVVKLPPVAVYRIQAINYVDIDEEKSAVMLRDYKAVSGFDGQMFDNLIRRALAKPALMGFDIKQVVFLVIICIIIAGISAYFGYTNADKIATLAENMGKGVV